MWVTIYRSTSKPRPHRVFLISIKVQTQLISNGILFIHENVFIAPINLLTLNFSEVVPLLICFPLYAISFRISRESILIKLYNIFHKFSSINNILNTSFNTNLSLILYLRNLYSALLNSNYLSLPKHIFFSLISPNLYSHLHSLSFKYPQRLFETFPTKS